MRDKYRWDLLERIFWTAAQGALATVTVEGYDWPQWLIIPIMAGLAFLKGLVAKKIGDSGTASTLP